MRTNGNVSAARLTSCRFGTLSKIYTISYTYGQQGPGEALQAPRPGRGFSASPSRSRQRANAVLVSEDDWRSIQETLFLLSIPGMRESIRKGMKEPVAKCRPELEW